MSEENKRQVGSRYEQVAAAFLEKRGWTVLEKNYRCRRGEIDLICRDGRYLVFVEVKYRKDAHFGLPGEAVDWRKQQKIRKAASYYLYSHKLPEDTSCRFDVVGILGEQIDVIENAF
jgi:putative endonuclease